MDQLYDMGYHLGGLNELKDTSEHITPQRSDTEPS